MSYARSLAPDRAFRVAKNQTVANDNRLADVGGWIANTSGTSNTCHNGNHTTVGYDAIGNITQSSDAGTYTTNPSGPGSLLAHAVASIAVCSGCTVDGIRGGNQINFRYDANGNLLCETTASQCDASAINSVGWTSFNKPATVTHASTSFGYSYDPEHSRVEMQTSTTGYTDYLDDPASGVMSELVNPGVVPYYFRDYVNVDGRMIAIAIQYNGQSSSVYYPVLDHLGSVSVIIDGNQYQQDGSQNPNWGKAIDRYSFDAFGMARDPVQWTPRTCFDAPQGTFVRGFTGQEQMPASSCLINFNARIYSPTIGRFLSADPTVEAPYNPQDLNRYSYVLNDPLQFTDPSGLCFLGCFWKSSEFREGLALAVVIAFQQWQVVPAALGESSAFAASDLGLVVNGGILGGMSGAISTGSYKGAALGALQAALFAEAGNILQGPRGLTIFGSHDATTFIAHGFVGGLTSVASGHNFESGFLAAGVSSFADIYEQSGHDFGAIAYNTVEHAALGGLGSVMGGGKFQNGAVTGAFGYLFNECMHGECWASDNDISAYKSGGPYGFWKSMCAGGDPIACTAAGASANAPDPLTVGTVGKLWLETNYEFYHNGEQMTDQQLMQYSGDIANAYVKYLGAGKWPSWDEINQIHWNENARFGMPPSAYPGTPLGTLAPELLKNEVCPECGK